MNFIQASAWLQTVEKFVRSAPARKDLARLSSALRKADALTPGVACAAAFVADRAPDIAADLLAFHERYLVGERVKIVERAWDLFRQSIPTIRPAHRPKGSSPYFEDDYPALLFARMVWLGQTPKNASEAIRRAVAFAEAAGSPVSCHSDSARERRLRNSLKENRAELDEALNRLGFPVFEIK